MPKSPNAIEKPESSQQSGYFDIEYLKNDLKRRSVRAGAVTLTSQGTKLFLNIFSTAVLARLLTPNDFGMIAMVAAITNFVALFKDLGLSMATVQRAHINHTQISTLFWINIVLSCVLMILTAILSPAIALFYGNSHLKWITAALSVIFLLGGLTVQHQALLRRHMRFGILAFIEIISLGLGIIAGITAGLNGLGVWALVLMQIVQATATAMGVWVSFPWRPGLPGRSSGVREMISFGANLTATNVVNYIARNMDNILIGKISGGRLLGLYSKAYSLLLLPIRQINGPISSVAIPSLSHLQNSPVQFKNYYCKAISLIAFIGMPLIVILMVLADKFILLILGEQWLEVVPIFRVLGPSAFIGTLNVATGWVFVALGHVRKQLILGTVMSALLSLSYCIGIYWGVMGIAIARSLHSCVWRLPQIIYCYRGTPLSLKDLIIAVWRPLVASLMSGLLLLGVNTLIIIDLVNSVYLLLNIAEYILFYTLIWMLLPSGKKNLFENITLIRAIYK